MSLLPITTAIPFAEPLLEQPQEQDININTTSSSDDDEEEEEDEEGQQAVVVQLVTQRSNSNTSHCHRRSSGLDRCRYVFLWSVYFVGGTVSSTFLTWSVIELFLGVSIPFQSILVTVTIVALLLCYVTGRVRCSVMGTKKQKKHNKKQNQGKVDDGGSRNTVSTTLQEVLVRHVAGGDVVSVHASSPCQGFSSSKKMNNTVPVHASPPCQSFSSSQNRNNTVVPMHASPPCQGFSSQNRNTTTDSSLHLLPVQDILPTVLHASPPCQGFSSKKMDNTVLHVQEKSVLHASSPCQGSSSSIKKMGIVQ